MVSGCVLTINTNYKCAKAMLKVGLERRKLKLESVGIKPLQ